MQAIPLPAKINALGGKYEHIKISSRKTAFRGEDTQLELVPVDDLFGRSAEKIGEQIVAQI